MKKFVILGFIIAASTAAAQTGTFTAPTTSERTTTRTTRHEETVRSAPRPVGAFVRTSRNPVQLINPLAPREYYGPPEETVVSAPRTDRRPDEVAKSGPVFAGVILFGWRW